MSERIPSSFRDPAGYVFSSGGEVFRLVTQTGRAGYERFMASGLYDDLAGDSLLVSHDDTGPPQDAVADGWRVLKPLQLRFISYPYEWPFSFLKQAALLTLTIERRALARGLSLRDASAYNVQMHQGRPIFIDTLSFGEATAGPWPAYRQFCEHFLAPLALMALGDIRAGRTLQSFVDGLPLDMTSRLLPRRSWVRPGLLAHVHMHALAGRRLATRPSSAPPAATPASHSGRAAILDSLERTIEGLRWTPRGSWTGYVTEQPSYQQVALDEKERLVRQWLEGSDGPVWDLGANTGRFSRIATALGLTTVAFDGDAGCVELMYDEARRRGDTALTPLVQDLTSPSPSVGWANQERSALASRGPAGTVMALALVHHLAIGANVPLPQVASYLAALGRRLIIEFVPKDDAMVQALLAHREDIFPDYSFEGFSAAFARHFRVVRHAALPGSGRHLFEMARA